MNGKRGLRGWVAELGYHMAASACMMCGVPWPSHDAVFGRPRQDLVPPPALPPGHPERLIPDVRPNLEERSLWDQLSCTFARHLGQL